MQLSDINLMDLDLIAERIPHEELALLRREAPVWLHPEQRGPGCWVVSKYDDVVKVSRDWETFSSDAHRGGVIGMEENPEAQAAADLEGNMMLTMDPPRHTRYRKLVNKGFTPRMVSALEDQARLTSTRIIDKVIEKGECDYVVDIAAELPLAVIADLMGVPEEDHHKIFEWSNQLVGSQDPEYQVSRDEVMGAAIEMFTYANALGKQRRNEPRGDIVTALLTAEVDGDTLTEQDFDLFFMLLAVAGNETTRNVLSHGAHALMEHPDERQKLIDDPALMPTAVEEILRWATPVMYFRRNVTRDCELRGQQLHEGDKVAIWYMSANRDEDVFDDPFRFDVQRTPNEHVAFGGGGPHFCLGASLARLELRVMLTELMRRMPDMEMAGPPVRLRSNFLNGIKHLPITFSPGPREAD